MRVVTDGGSDPIGDFLQQSGGIAEPLIAAMLHYY
jgi:hypothetical protein